jgi:hypothetical protein
MLFCKIRWITTAELCRAQSVDSNSNLWPDCGKVFQDPKVCDCSGRQLTQVLWTNSANETLHPTTSEFGLKWDALKRCPKLLQQVPQIPGALWEAADQPNLCQDAPYEPEGSIPDVSCIFYKIYQTPFFLLPQRLRNP